MNPKKAVGITIAGIALAILGTGFAVRSDTPPKAATVAVPVHASAADLFNGKIYPLILKSEQIDSSFHMANMIDAQGHSTVLATKGDMATFGGETFLVCYDVPLTSALAHLPQPKAGTIAQLILINMRDLEGVSKIIPIMDSDLTGDTEKPLK